MGFAEMRQLSTREQPSCGDGGQSFRSRLVFQKSRVGRVRGRIGKVGHFKKFVIAWAKIFFCCSLVTQNRCGDGRSGDRKFATKFYRMVY